MRTLMTNATRLHVCQRCPRLLRRYAQGEKRAAFEGLQDSGVKYGSLFHKYIAEAFHRDASGPQNPRREALCAALAGDVSGLPGRLREYVDRYCYELFLEKHGAEHSTEVLLSLAAGAERWIRSLAEFLSGVPLLCANPRALMPQVFCLSEQRPDAQVVTPVIKANLQLRIALKVAGRSNSQIILGDNVAQAQNLLGYGDMFVGSSVPLQRLQGAFA